MNTRSAMGNVPAIIYFENSSGELVMPVYDAGRPEQAREVFEARFRSNGWEWKEAGTWTEVTKLQDRLVAQEETRRSRMRESEQTALGPARAEVIRALHARMSSAGCSDYEKEFIRCWIQLRTDKRAKYEQAFKEHHSYLWAVEMNEGTKIEDRMPAQPGEFWRG